MNILIKSARIVDPGSKHHGKTLDLLIENGIITTIAPVIQAEKNVKIIEHKNMHASVGWMDMQVNFCDPGFEYKEDLTSGMHAAAAGGFTDVAIVPSTNPPLHSKSQILYVKNHTRDNIVSVHPLGTLSHKQEGTDLSEMYDMKIAGAVAFSDDKKPVTNAGLLTRALLYIQNFDGTILTHCNEKTISTEGKMNEGLTSTRLGLEGMPALAEELMVMRNIFIAEYTNAPLHILTVSTKKSAELIREAKAKGLKITASVTAYNLSLDETMLDGFDSNYKLDPPLRSKSDIEALHQALTDGTIDVITSDHRPQDIDSKEVEFAHAANGMIGLETAFALVNTYKGKIKLETLIMALTQAPRAVLKLKQPVIAEGEKACITLFDPAADWIYEEKNIQSKSKNTPFINKVFKGKVIGILHKKQLALNK